VNQFRVIAGIRAMFKKDGLAVGMAGQNPDRFRTAVTRKSNNPD
jgi:hypothetical protein